MLSTENHEWFNKQSEEHQAEMNRKFQEYKKCNIVLDDNIHNDFDLNFTEIILEPEKNKKKYNRNNEKRKNKRRIDEDLEL